MAENKTKTVKVEFDILNPRGQGSGERDVLKELERAINGLKGEVKGASEKKPKDGSSGGGNNNRGSLDTDLSKSLRDIDEVNKKTNATTKLMLKGVGAVATGIQSLVSGSVEFLNSAAKKMIGANSLLIDKEVANMMQKTGQNAEEANATMRSLERLGLSMEDLQSGRLTPAQAAEFEKIRDRELEKLAEIEAKSGNALTAMQSATLGYDSLMADIADFALLALLENSEGVEELANMANELFGKISVALEGLIPIVGEVIGSLMGILESLWPILDMVIGLFQELLPPLMSVIGVLADALIPLLDIVVGTIGGMLESLMPAIVSILGVIELILPILSDILAPILEYLGMVLNIVASVVGTVVEVLAKMLAPVLKVLGTIVGALSKALSSLIGWISGIYDWVLKFLGLKKEGGTAIGLDSDPNDFIGLGVGEGGNTNNNVTQNNFNYPGGNPTGNHQGGLNSSAIKLNIGGIGS